MSKLHIGTGECYRWRRRWTFASTLTPSGSPHIWGHNVSEQEVEDVLTNPGEDRPGHEESRVALGQTVGGRYLKVIYVLDSDPGSIFVITAYELRGLPLKAYKRRRKKKHK